MDSLPKDVLNMVIDYTKQSVAWTDQITKREFYLSTAGDPTIPLDQVDWREVTSTLIIETARYRDIIEYKVDRNSIKAITALLTCIETKVNGELVLIGIDYGASIDLFFEDSHLSVGLNATFCGKYRKTIPDEVIPRIVDWLKHIVDLFQQ